AAVRTIVRRTVAVLRRLCGRDLWLTRDRLRSIAKSAWLGSLRLSGRLRLSADTLRRSRDARGASALRDLSLCRPIAVHSSTTDRRGRAPVGSAADDVRELTSIAGECPAIAGSASRDGVWRCNGR